MAIKFKTTKDQELLMVLHPFVRNTRNKIIRKGILLFYMDSCPGLAVVTFISLLLNAAFGFRWFNMRKRNAPNPLLQTQYRESLVEAENDLEGVVSI